MIDAVCIRDPVYRVGELEWEKGEIDYVRRKILLVCLFFFISVLPKETWYSLWLGGGLRPLSPDMQHSVQRHAGDMWGVQ